MNKKGEIGLILMAIVAIVAMAGLFLSLQGGAQAVPSMSGAVTGGIVALAPVNLAPVKGGGSGCTFIQAPDAGGVVCKGAGLSCDPAINPPKECVCDCPSGGEECVPDSSCLTDSDCGSTGGVCEGAVPDERFCDTTSGIDCDAKGGQMTTELCKVDVTGLEGSVCIVRSAAQFGQCVCPEADLGLDMVCELKVDEAGEDEDDEEIISLDERRVAKELSFETHNADPALLDLWNALFSVVPGTSPSDIVTLKAPDRTVTWKAGTLEMGGAMKLKVKTNKKSPGLKEVKIEKAGKKEGTTLFVSGTGGVNPNLADGGWHDVKVRNMDGVTVTFNGYSVTGFLKELEVKFDKDGTTASPIVKEFKVKIKGATSAADIKKGTVTSVIVEVPETVITALAGVDYEEKVKDEPEVLGGHTEAEAERDSDALTELADISSLIDGMNNQLKERKGACTVSGEGAPLPTEPQCKTDLDCPKGEGCDLKSGTCVRVRVPI